MFDGRLAEDFKLATGSGVHVGQMRTRLVATAGVLAEAVVCSHDRDCAAALGWVNHTEAQRVYSADADVELDHPALREHLAERLQLNGGAGSASSIAPVLLEAPPSIDAREISDNGHVNQRLVLELRSKLLHRLFAEPIHARVITPRSA